MYAVFTCIEYTYIWYRVIEFRDKYRQIFHNYLDRNGVQERMRKNMCLPQKNSTKEVETEYANHLSEVLLVDPIQQLTTFFASARLLLPRMDGAYFLFFGLSRREKRRLRNPCGKKIQNIYIYNLPHPSDSIKTWPFLHKLINSKNDIVICQSVPSRCVPKKPPG